MAKDEKWGKLPVIFPPPELCTGQKIQYYYFHYPLVNITADNAAMIGWASMYRFLEGRTDDYSIEPRPKWSIEDIGEIS